MILKELSRNRLLTINFYQNGLLRTCRGRVKTLNTIEQTLSLEDENQNIFYIRLSGIREIF
ncbi:YolD-like family protein [Actinomycetes bacterium NPDC127524]